MTENENLELLKEEYFHLHRAVQEFDSKALTIKAWSVTVSMAGIGVALRYDIPMLSLASACSAILFWVVEAIWKSFQRGFLERIEQLEPLFLGDMIGAKPLQIRTTWLAKVGDWEKLKPSIWEMMAKPEVWLPHGPVAVVGIALGIGYYAYKFIHGC